MFPDMEEGKRDRCIFPSPIGWCARCFGKWKDGNKILISPDHCEEEARIAWTCLNMFAYSMLREMQDGKEGPYVPESQ